MTATLGDMLLVFLADRPATPYELQQRHAATFGPEHAVGINRVVNAVNRQERLGHVRLLNGAARRAPRVCTLTETGRERQRAWLLDIPQQLTRSEVLDRVLLTMAAADRETFETVIAGCLAVLEPQRRRRHTTATVSAPHALAEYEDAVTGALCKWLRDLSGRTRDRDAA
ncbi:DNA-binding PadR family transcriptional regulator [Actinoplanes octamycinicus]|uniref:DNA-binding PadR family transcriptional regulator n=1 Tax=Actinoplanes octamycinicus TaxID=135948 RepID=A0A7W7H2W5_9ACTN|nr:hypothetical protein [Actinoplanes octamycinicus]MBB4742985.1 DNA-binding PadR family transcriptional regulator [Actinoplanes octamycinicus]GIE58161.1 hypothetical protein Aoc01nite_35630 [Actinoplanes octamycinicus]